MDKKYLHLTEEYRQKTWQTILPKIYIMKNIRHFKVKIFMEIKVLIKYTVEIKFRRLRTLLGYETR